MSEKCQTNAVFCLCTVCSLRNSAVAVPVAVAIAGTANANE